MLFSGIPAGGDVGDTTVTLDAIDIFGSIAQQTFKVTVIANTVPTVR